MVLDATTALNKWRAGVQNGAAAYKTGIQNSGDWAGNFAASEQTMATNLMAAIQSGKVTAAVQQLGTQGWRNQALAKAGNYTTGVGTPQAGQNYLAGYQKLSGWIGNAQNQIASMPKSTYAERVARLNAYIQSMHDQAST